MGYDLEFNIDAKISGVQPGHVGALRLHDY